MKHSIHPYYHIVIFYDTNADTYFKIPSTILSKETIKWEDGNTYPLVKVDISSASHPLYTTQRVTSGEGQGLAAQFQRRFGNIGQKVKGKLG